MIEEFDVIGRDRLFVDRFLELLLGNGKHAHIGEQLAKQQTRVRIVFIFKWNLLKERDGLLYLLLFYLQFGRCNAFPGLNQAIDGFPGISSFLIELCCKIKILRSFVEVSGAFRLI